MPKKSGTEAGGEFRKLDVNKLDSVAIVPQALDNQWVPRDLLRQMMDKGWSLKDVAGYRDPVVRTEYIRALINASQVVINRAFIYNNPVVYQDFRKRSLREREAFKALIANEVVIPFLYNEETPTQEPTYAYDKTGFRAWVGVCRDVQVTCARLSWDPEDNRAQIKKHLSQRFHEFAQVASARESLQFAEDLGLAKESAPGLLKQLKKVSEVCNEAAPENVTRDQMYRCFVTVDGTPPDLGCYDKSKDFSGEIKQLLDLRYNTSLPDKLDRFALTPAESLTRTALQEPPEKTSDVFTPEELGALIQRSAFEITQGGLHLESMRHLTLNDVVGIRGTDEWETYIASLRRLLQATRDAPSQFLSEQVGAPAVYRSYLALAHAINRVARERKTATWIPVIELAFVIGSATLTIIWSENDTRFSMIPALSPLASSVAPVVARLIIRGYTEIGSQADLRTSIDFLTGRVRDARDAWTDLLGRLDAMGIKEVTEGSRRSLQPVFNQGRPEDDAE